MAYDLDSLDVASLLKLRSEIDAEMARRTRTGIVVWTGRDGRVAAQPSGGAVLREHWATEEHSQCTWYPSLDAACAALQQLATREGRAWSQQRLDVDLTSSGCLPSWARVVDYEAPP